MEVIRPQGLLPDFQRPLEESLGLGVPALPPQHDAQLIDGSGVRGRPVYRLLQESEFVRPVPVAVYGVHGEEDQHRAPEYPGQRFAGSLWGTFLKVLKPPGHHPRQRHAGPHRGKV